MLRIVRLYYSLAGLSGAARPADDLRQHGKGALARAVIVKIKRHIGKQNADERYIGKIVSLCHHLRPKQNIRLVCAEAAEHFVICLAR